MVMLLDNPFTHFTRLQSSNKYLQKVQINSLQELPTLCSAVDYLSRCQNKSGGFGGGPGILCWSSFRMQRNSFKDNCPI
jgi:hypothetical protein